MDRLTERHQPSGECWPNIHCSFHGIDATVTGSTFKVCFECGHVFQTGTEILTEANAFHVAMERAVPGAELPRYTDPNDIDFCPFCTHDL
jgi:hypothetical protein